VIVISVVNTKGGVGKTTLASALAVRAAQEGRVAMVDLDPQRSLVSWWARRGKSDNPEIFEGPETAQDAVETLRLNSPCNYVFIDGPPAHLMTIEDMVQAADYVLIPIKPSAHDLIASQDAVVLARRAEADFGIVFNDVRPRETAVRSARNELLNFDLPILDTEIRHRVSHINGAAKGKSAAELRDKAATAEIDNLWAEVRQAASSAVKRRAKEGGEGADVR
jgi:chromosome partitioning protein